MASKSKGKTVTNNSWNNQPAGCTDDHDAAQSLGGSHPKRQPPNLSPFAPTPGAGSSPFSPPESDANPDAEY